jgi:hypothetical protein
MNDMLAPAAPVLDPITVEVIGASLSSIVEETGEALIRASYSTNIKERRDCSTALFNAAGYTLCQAEHIPIHLGSFIGIVPHIMKLHPVEEMRPGDVFVGMTPMPAAALICRISCWPSRFSWMARSPRGPSTSRIIPILPIAATRTSTRRVCAFRRCGCIAKACCRRISRI